MRLAAAALLVSLTGLAHATEWELSLDTRLVDSTADRSFIEGGLGNVRFDRDDAPVQLGRARFALTQHFGELWSAHLDVSAWDDKEAHLLGVTEAYLQLRPYPFAGYRVRVKAGAFYPPVSLENRAGGWESPYSISFSAIDSWLATEVRTLGLEGQLEWLGTRTGHRFDLAATGGVFGWNEGAGSVIAGTGFLLHDRQTPIFGQVGQPGVPPLYGATPFHEIDGRAGVYAGLEARYLDRLVLRVLRYDNRADPSALDAVSGQIAWETRFTSAGVRAESERGWTFIAQYLDGDTTIAPGGTTLSWPFRSAFALIAKRFGRNTLSARYDTFAVSPQGFQSGWQDGHAFTAAYAYEAGAHWRFALEWLRVVASSYNREELYGLGPLVHDTQVQLAVRYALGSAR
jgi:hypothetical protein